MAARSLSRVFCILLPLVRVMSFQRASLLASRKSLLAFGSQQLPTRTRRASFFGALLGGIEKEVDPGVVAGTDLRIVKYPHPALRRENVEITDEELKDGSIAKLAKEMFLVLYAAQGVGLAAPQVGVNKRLMVYNESGDRQRWLDEVVMVNPEIVEFSDATVVDTEGCLSFPDMNGQVKRSKWIKVEATTLKGKKMKKKFTDWEARIFQHEYDHLDGTVYIDRLTEEGRKEVQPRLDELIAEFGEGGSL
jgi:peptide deformylase